MSTYTSITIIYNPNSTGSSKDVAESAARELRAALPNQKITLSPTKYAGHAEELAFELAQASKNPLIISASGDGGYHEVVNGIMHAGGLATSGLLPTGNANDHHRNISNENFIKDVVHQAVQCIDVIKFSTQVNKKSYVRYAHSYIGFGLTPKAGRELNKTSLNWVNEKWAVIKTIISLKSTPLVVNGKRRNYDNLVFSNIADMSKVLSLSHVAEPDDGKFEITGLRHRNKIYLLRFLFKAVTSGLKSDYQYTEFELTTVRPTLVQLDGEIATIDANALVQITSEKQSLRCIV